MWLPSLVQIPQVCCTAFFSRIGLLVHHHLLPDMALAKFISSFLHILAWLAVVASLNGYG